MIVRSHAHKKLFITVNKNDAVQHRKLAINIFLHWFEIENKTIGHDITYASSIN